MNKKCETCIKRKTKYWHNSIECWATDDKAYYRNKIMLLEENQELKKQLEEYIKQNMKLKNELFDKRKEYQDTYKDVRIEIKEYKTQQKEFIKWLEDYINLFDKKDIYEEGSCDMLEEILQKYRSIIGDDR